MLKESKSRVGLIYLKTWGQISLMEIEKEQVRSNELAELHPKLTSHMQRRQNGQRAPPYG